MIMLLNKSPIHKSIATFSSFIVLFICTSVNAEIVNGTHWLVRPGESTYSIARKLYPDDLKQRELFRTELMRINSDAFKDGTNTIKVGSKLKLPDKYQNETITKNAPATQSVAIKPSSTPVENIGRVIANIGHLEAENNGSIRSLKRNSAILMGDILKTARNSQAQIRLKDGALVSLIPNTEFQIEEYVFNDQIDSTEKSVLNLIKGGFRTITGLIGHRNKKNYIVRTSVATIGIRGTHYGLMSCTDGSCASEYSEDLADGLYGGVVDGSIFTENETGIREFNNDQYFHIASPRTPPIEILLPPPVFKGIDRSQPVAKVIQDTDENIQKLSDSILLRNAMTLLAFNDVFQPFNTLQRLPDQNSNTYNLPLPPKAPDNSAALFAANTSAGTLTFPSIVNAFSSDAIYLGADSTGNILPVAAIDWFFTPVIGTNNFALPYPSQATPADFGTDINNAVPNTAIIWGRWANAMMGKDGELSNLSNVHFIYSNNVLTPVQLAGLTGSATYNSTILRATDSTGTPYTEVNGTITMGATFGPAGQINTYSMNIGSLNLLATANNIPFTDLGRNFGLACSSGCTSGSASVQFIGSNAQGAITSFSTNDAFTPVSGTALLTTSTPPL